MFDASTVQRETMQSHQEKRDRIQTLVFTPFTLSTMDQAQPLRPQLARDLSYGNQRELTDKLHDLWYSSELSPSREQQQQQLADHDPYFYWREPSSHVMQGATKQTKSVSSSSSASAQSQPHEKRVHFILEDTPENRARALSLELEKKMKIGVIGKPKCDIKPAIHYPTPSSQKEPSKRHRPSSSSNNRSNTNNSNNHTKSKGGLSSFRRFFPRKPNHIQDRVSSSKTASLRVVPVKP